MPEWKVTGLTPDTINSKNIKSDDNNLPWKITGYTPKTLPTANASMPKTTIDTNNDKKFDVRDLVAAKKQNNDNNTGLVKNVLLQGYSGDVFDKKTYDRINRSNPFKDNNIPLPAKERLSAVSIGDEVLVSKTPIKSVNGNTANAVISPPDKAKSENARKEALELIDAQKNSAKSEIDVISGETARVQGEISQKLYGASGTYLLNTYSPSELETKWKTLKSDKHLKKLLESERSGTLDTSKLNKSDKKLIEEYKIFEAYNKKGQTLITAVDNTVRGGIDMIEQSITAGADFFYNAIPRIFNKGDIVDYSDKFKSVNNDMVKSQQAVIDYGGTAGEVAYNVGANAIAMIPTILAGYATGGASVVASPLAAGSQSLTPAMNYVTNLVKNPVYWTAVSQEFSSSYAQSYLNGEDMNLATLKAFTIGMINGAIEIGSGVETRLGTDTGERIWQAILNSSKEEGLEEGVQGGISTLFDFLFGVTTNNATGDKYAYSKPKELLINTLKEMGIGALSGMLMTASTQTINSFVSPDIAKTISDLGENAVKGKYFNALIEWGKDSGNIQISDIANSPDIQVNNYKLGQLFVGFTKLVNSKFDTQNETLTESGMVKSLYKLADTVMPNSPLYTGIVLPQFANAMKTIGVSNDTTIKYITDISNSIYEKYDKLKTSQIAVDYNSESGETVPGNEDVVSGDDVSETAEEADFNEEESKSDDNDGTVFHNPENVNDIFRHIEKTAKALDPTLKIVFLDKLHRGGKVDENTNGKYDRNRNTLYIKKGLSVSEMYVEVFKHEFMHSLETRKLYAEFKDYLFNKSKAFESYVRLKIRYETGEEFNDSKKSAIEKLSDIYIKRGYSEQEVPYEMVADFFSECLLKGKSGRSEMANELGYGGVILPNINAESELDILSELSQNEPTLLQRIKDFFKELLQKIKGQPIFRTLEADLTYLDSYIQKLYDSRKAKNTAESGEVKHSIENTIVDLSNETELNSITQKLKGAKKYKAIQQYILDKIGNDFTLSDGLHITVDKSDALHISNKSANKKTAEISAIDKLIKTAEIYAEDTNVNHNKFNYFVYYQAFVRYNEYTFPIYLNIGKGKNDGEYHLYDITHKIRDTAHRINGVERLREFRSANGISTNSISNNPENVKEIDKEYLELAKEPEKNRAQLEKMVEEFAKKSGYSEKLYHQTNNDFYIFNTRHEGAGTRDDETPFGIFMKKTDADIGLKGKKQVGLFAKIKKPLKAYNRENLVEQLERLSPEYKTIKKEHNTLDKEYQKKFDDAKKAWRYWIEEWRKKNPNAKRTDAYNEPEFESVFSQEEIVIDEWTKKATKLEKEAKKVITSVLKSNGYDGVILLNDQGSFGRRTDAYIALESSQVKSADIVTYDDNGNIITLSDRFNSDNDDIRYSISPEHLRYNPEKYMHWLLRHFHVPSGSGYVEAFSPRLEEIVKLYNKGGTENTENAEYKLNQLTMDMAESVPYQINEWSKELLDYIKKTTVSLSDKQKAEILYNYKSISEFKKETGIKISDTAIPLDSQWQEWVEEYPSYFKSDINEGDMPSKLAEIIYSAKNDFEQRDDRYLADEIAKEIMHTIRITGKRAENKRIASAIKYGYEFGYDEGKNLLEEYRKNESIKKGRRLTRQNISEMQRKVVKLGTRFNKAVINPTKKNFIPTGIQKTAYDCIKMLEEIVDTENVVYETKYADRLLEIKQLLEFSTDLSEKEFQKYRAEFLDLYNTAIEENKLGHGVELEYLSQQIAMENDIEKKAKLIEKFNKLYNGERDFGINFQNIADEISKIEKQDDGNNDFAYAELTKSFSELAAYIKGKMPREYTGDDWRNIYNAFAQLDNAINNYNQLIGETKARDVAERGQRMIDETNKAIEMPWLAERAISSFMDVVSYFKRLGNYQKNSEWAHWAKRLNDGQHEKTNYKRKALMRFTELMQDEKTAEMFDTKNLVECGLVTKSGTPVLVPKEFRLKLALDSLDEKAYNHILINGVTIPEKFDNYYKRGLTDAGDFKRQCFIKDVSKWQDTIFDSLSEIEVKWAKAMKEYYISSGKALNEVFFKINGFYRQMNENYSHIIVDDSFRATMFGKIQDGSTVMHPGFMEERVGDVKTMYGVGAISQLMRDIDAHAEYVGMAIPLYDFNKVYNYNTGGVTLQSLLDEKYNRTATRYINDAINDLIGNSRQIGNDGIKWIYKIISKLKGNYAQAVLSANARVAFTQTASFPMAYITLDAKSMAKAFAYIEDQNEKKHIGIARAERDVIDDITPLVWLRTQGYKTDDIEDAVNGLSHTKSQKLADRLPHILKWVNMFDEITVNRLFYASKFYVEDHYDYEKGSEEYNNKLREIFEETIELTQPNYTVLQRSPLMRSGSKSEILGAIMMFKTVPSMQLNRIIDSALELKTKLSQKESFTEAEIKEAKVKFGKTITAITVSNLQLAFLRAIVDALLNGFKRYRDKENEVTVNSVALGIAKDFVETPLGMFPLVGGVLGSIVEGALTGEKPKFYDVTMPQFDSINNAITDFSNIANNLSSDSFDFAKTMKSLLYGFEDITSMYGYSFKNIRNNILGGYYSIKDICNKLQNDGYFFEAAVEDNLVNRIFGSSIKTQSQKISTIISYLDDGNFEKSDTLIEDFKKEYPDKDIFSEIVKGYKKENAIISKSESEINKSDKFNALSEEKRNSLSGDIKKYYATDKVIKARKIDPKVFDLLYEKKRKSKSQFELQVKELKKAGYTDKEIELGIEYAKVRYMKSIGINIADYFAAKGYTSIKYADTDGNGGVTKNEKKNSLRKAGYSERQITELTK